MQLGCQRGAAREAAAWTPAAAPPCIIRLQLRREVTRDRARVGPCCVFIDSQRAMRRTLEWIAIGAVAGAALALVPVARGQIEIENPVAKLSRPSRPKLDGLDLMRLDQRPNRVTAPLPEGRTAELTID